jgi:hypothetical protein
MWLYPHVVIRPEDNFASRFQRCSIARECNPLVRLKEVPQRESRNERFQHRCSAVGRVVVYHNNFPIETRRDLELRERMQRLLNEACAIPCAHRDSYGRSAARACQQEKRLIVEDCWQR